MTLQVSDAPYEPLQSPLREDLPPMPGAQDLDREIEQAQAELERCRRENVGHSDTLSYNTGDRLVPSALRDESVTDRASATAEKKPSKKKRGAREKEKRTLCALLWRIFKFFLVTFVMLALMLCIVVVIAMETDSPILLIQDLREWPEVAGFRDEYYWPVRERTVDSIRTWFS